MAATKTKHKYRIKVAHGVHSGPDLAADPVEVRGADGTITKKQPSRLWKQGEVFDSEVDLVATQGAKFAHVGTAPEDVTPPAGHSFPGGQVSTGLQRTTGTPDGGQSSGLIPPADAAEAARRAQAEAAEGLAPPRAHGRK